MKLSWLVAATICCSLWVTNGATEAAEVEAEEAGVEIPQVEAPSDEELEQFEVEDYDFMAETDRLMNIIINSLYTDRDVFIRELISNAADALEKIRLLGLQNPKMLKGFSGEAFEEYKILVKIDKERNEITVTDTGIGMTKEELAKNLGTVAKSGTKGFIEAAQKGMSASNLIGQFGVGFYSSFLVADKVTVISKSPSDPNQHIWVSSAQGKFKVFKDKRHDKLERGTSIILTMKEDAQNYLDKTALKKVITRFSEFVNFPIFLASVKPNDDVIEWKLVNSKKPLWLREKSTITDAEYNEFYKAYFTDSQPPMGYTHFVTEGDIEFTAIMYVPTTNRDDLTQLDKSTGSKIKLFVQQVLISDTLKDFMPLWLNFVKGVIHSGDLPLKVDREMFTQSRVMRVIKNKTINKVFELLKGMSREAEREVDENPERIKEIFQRQAFSNDRTEITENTQAMQTEYPKYSKYSTFWNKFGASIVFGCMQESSREDKRKIMELFRTSSSVQPFATSLASYVSRMKPGQKKIYYLTGDSLDAMRRSPYMEIFDKHGIEVLLLSGAFEEGCLSQTAVYKEYEFQSIEKNEFKDDEFAFVKAGGDQEKQQEVAAEMKRDRRAQELYYKPLLQWAGKSLDVVNAQAVTLSKTLVSSPAMITSPSHGFTAAHEKLARTALQGNQMMFNAFAMMKNFELNPDHPLVHHLLQEVQDITEKKEYDSKRAKELNHTLDVVYECAMIASGYPPRRPHIIIQDVYKHISADQIDSFKLSIPTSIYKQVDKEPVEKQPKGDDMDYDLDDDDDDDLFDPKDEL
eukprot:Protomagalhaensia_sp_Gyna_25__1849@NODE_197_length_4503_cov_25_391129_g152_i0_p1_GENE_NODE_197_length_4503_cov_25_391129_g152_i0NODE_197_length_4503_cov_25_391129_g152_i0_p1_ORF_typecomplete_len802_score204_26HSP90/PF00183_18/2_3e106HATPase_c_3/PF13589_6/3_2e27HATPase_c/PF02518_26/4_5e07CENPX/PF09415_10/9e03CENPX/PF09415_10/0_12_NODE_197_length_4503_cov_25_391129_g152_i0532458